MQYSSSWESVYIRYDIMKDKDENSMKKEAHIIYERYYDFKNDRVVSGGVQTYISNLIPLLRINNYECTVYQFSEEPMQIDFEIDGTHIISVPNSEKNGICMQKIMMAYVCKKIDKNDDLLIFADHILTCENDIKHAISIQHGIHWDVKKDISRNNIKMFFSKARFAYSEHKKMQYVNRVICVDHNFLNWYRAQVDIPNGNFSVIPNFTKIAPRFKKIEGRINIIFARRFVKHRGTRVFVEAIAQILEEFEYVYVTIAGRGPDEAYLHEKLNMWPERVSFIQYTADQSLSIHKDKHIAVVPTIGSEGTSLSLLEAMSAQCAVVCTDVGGMTNIVLDDYNGKMVEAGNPNQLFVAIKELIEDNDHRIFLAERGFDTVKNAFSYEKWAQKWMKVLRDIQNEK